MAQSDVDPPPEGQEQKDPPVVRRAASLVESRALAHPLRLRMLRLCKDAALTNKELAMALGQRPATVLHHVRTLVATGLLAEEPWRPGSRGATEKPYRSTGKSWRLDVGESGAAGAIHRAMFEAVSAEVDEAGPEAIVESARMAMRLRPDQMADLLSRIRDLIADYGLIHEPDGEPLAMLVVLHRRPAAPAAPASRA